MTRASQAQRPPDPAADWVAFPVHRPRAGSLLWRAARRSRPDPWWFCTCGDCRFDLDPPRGTCYAGTDELCGVLETIGYEWVSSGIPLTPTFVRGRVLHSAAAADLLDGPLANLTSRKALGFRITNELTSMTPYDVPRAFARVLDATRNARGRRAFGGIRFRTRFDTSSTAHGVAIFGAAGSHSAVASFMQEITDGLVDSLVDLGVSIEDAPPLSALTVLP